ncbi:MAG: hypothetical protein JXR37_09015 [Kiritimatiellae bacterium]|nr:hypothetical protein [Kiritimatiellia bacterium]
MTEPDDATNAAKPSRSRLPWPHRLARTAISLALFMAGMRLVPYPWCARHADAWYDGQPDLQAALADNVAEWVARDLDRTNFDTGSAQFDGEWLFGSYMMAGLGFGQLALQQPDRRADCVKAMAICIERLLSPKVRAFDREMWGNDPIETLDAPPHHAAYLGYFNLVLSFHRLLAPDSAYAELNDRITEALVRRVGSSPTLLIESYPAEIYPVDNGCVIGSIGLHARATGTDRTELLARWAAMCRRRYADEQTGLLYQCVARNGVPLDKPRGSGTALGLYALSFADMALSRELYAAAKCELADTFLGFGGIREYPRSIRGGMGDIDSGPIVLGFGLSPTGFLIAGARIHEDRAQFKRLYATAYLCGAPYAAKGRLRFITGGPLGDSILLAMLTAPHGGVAGTGNAERETRDEDRR